MFIDIQGEFLPSLTKARATAKRYNIEEIEARRKKLAHPKDDYFKERWSYYDDKIDVYDNHFSSVLHEGFEKYINSKGPVHVLDAFAPASFIRDLSKKTNNVKGGVALTLADLRSDEERDYDNKSNIMQLSEASLYDSKKWADKVRSDYLLKNNKRGFDIITCLPIGGWEIYSSNEGKGIVMPSPDLLWTVVNNLWKFLDKNGTMFIQFKSVDGNLIKEWMDFAKQKAGLNIQYSDGGLTVRIDRNNSSHIQFPFPKRIT